MPTPWEVSGRLHTGVVGSRRGEDIDGTADGAEEAGAAGAAEEEDATAEADGAGSDDTGGTESTTIATGALAGISAGARVSTSCTSAFVFDGGSSLFVLDRWTDCLLWFGST